MICRSRYVVFLLLTLLGLLVVAEGCKKKEKSEQQESYAIARSAFEQKDYDQAEKILADVIAGDADEHRDSALVEDKILYGLIKQRCGEYDSASAAFNQSIELDRQLGDKRLERDAKLADSRLLQELGLNPEALSLASQSATLAVLLSDWQNEYSALDIVRSARQSMGMYRDAGAVLDSLSHIDAQWLGNAHTPEIIRAKFQLYLEMNDRDKLRGSYVAWKQSASSDRDTSAIEADVAWGEAMQELGATDSAFHAYSQALDLLNLVSVPHLLARVLTNLGNLSFVGSKYDQARRYYADAFEGAKSTGNIRLRRALVLQEIACNVLSMHSQNPDSSTLVKYLADLSNTYGDRDNSIVDAYSLFLKGKMYESRNLPASALKEYLTAIDRYEASGGEEARPIAGMISAFMENQHTGWYQAPLQIYSGLDDAPAMLGLMERKNLYRLSNYFLHLPMEFGQPETDRAVRKLQFSAAAHELVGREAQSELAAGGSRDSVRLDRLIDEDTLQPTPSLYAGIPERIRTLLSPKSIAVKEIQDSLPPGSALMEFAPLAHSLAVIIVRKDTIIARKAAVDERYLKQIISEYEEQLSGADSGGVPVPMSGNASRIGQESSLLFNWFIAPGLPALKGIGTVYIVLPEEAGWLPVHSLQGEEKAFGAQFGVRYLPSAAMLLFPRGQDKLVQTITGFGYPGRMNWDVEYELKDIRSFYKDAVLVFAAAATIANLRSVTTDLLHLNTEFALDERHPVNSRLILSDGTSAGDGMIVSLGDLFSLSIPRTLVFSNTSPVPGCLNRYLPAVLFTQGVDCAILGMWQGERKAKMDFGAAFYTALQTAYGGGVPPAAAYDAAIKKLSSVPDGTKQWAVFYLWGK